MPPALVKDALSSKFSMPTNMSIQCQNHVHNSDKQEVLLLPWECVSSRLSKRKCRSNVKIMYKGLGTNPFQP